MNQEFKGKTVLITGAARGIGFCTAEYFAKAGATLILTDREPQALEDAAQRLRAVAAEVQTFVEDVSDKAQVEAMAKAVLEKVGSIDVLINNAGVGHNGELAETPLETWHKLMNVNFWGPLHHVYAFLPAMKLRGEGHIVNVSSGQAFFRMPTWGAYACTKLALGGFSEILHFELERYNIKVTTVYPFLVNTGFYAGMAPEGFAARWSMKLMPYYSDTPEKVGRVIFNAVLRKKRVEMVNLANDFGYYSRLIPHMSETMSKVTNWLLAKEPAARPPTTGATH